MNEELVRQAFRQQAIWCRNLGSPFTATLLDQLAARLDPAFPLARRILEWPGIPDARHDALPLRLAGALHALVRQGAAPALAALYPPNSTPDPEKLGDQALETLRTHAETLSPWLDSPPQTNEVARSAALMPGLMVIAHETGLPLSLFELGASAGLNLIPDRYAYRLGPLTAGAPNSPLLLAPEWRGPPPPVTHPVVIGRRGVDLNPIDVTNPAHQARLLAYIWPDQPDRLARATTAIALAAADPPELDRADAADWTERHLTNTFALGRTPGFTRVLMHSIAFQYFLPETQARIHRHATAIGAHATQTSPFAWLHLEVDASHDNKPTLQLTLWPGGTTRTLATASPHGHWVEWLV